MMIVMMVMTILLFVATKTICQDAAVTAAKFHFDTGVQMHIFWNVTLAKGKYVMLRNAICHCLVGVGDNVNPTEDLRHCWHPGI